VDDKLIDILACPICKGPLQWIRESRELLCRADRLAYPLQENIPVMLAEQARKLPPDDPALTGH
jgi:uncharacterized protein YbaR (Trm112 family)